MYLSVISAQLKQNTCIHRPDEEYFMNWWEEPSIVCIWKILRIPAFTTETAIETINKYNMWIRCFLQNAIFPKLFSAQKKKHLYPFELHIYLNLHWPQESIHTRVGNELKLFFWRLFYSFAPAHTQSPPIAYTYTRMIGKNGVIFIFPLPKSLVLNSTICVSGRNCIFIVVVVVVCVRRSVIQFMFRFWRFKCHIGSFIKVMPCCA